MRIFILGAGGFIGRHIVSELPVAGHTPVGAVRRVQDFVRAFPGVEAVACDLTRDISTQDRTFRLRGIDAVVNAAGLILGWPAFIGLIRVFWLMIARPSLWG